MLKKIDEKVIKFFVNKFSNKKLGQAYIFLGNENSIKNNTVKELFKIINCLKKPSLNSYCNECSNCVKVNNDFHPDFIEVLLLPGKHQLHKIQFTSDAGKPNPDKVISLNDKLKYTNYEAEYRFIIINSTDTMDAPCSNSFLKMLEEPPANTIFFLLTQNINNLLPTIISRCNVINLQQINTNDIIEYLTEKFKLSTEEVVAIMSTCADNYEEAEILLANKKFIEFRKETVEAILLFLKSKKYDKIIPFIKNYYDKYYKKDTENIFKKGIYNVINTIYRDILILNYCGNEKIINKDFLGDIKEISNCIDMNLLLKFSFKTFDSLKEVKFKLNPKIVLDNLFIEKEEEFYA